MFQKFRKLKSNWSEITVEQFIELREVEKLPFDSLIDKAIEIISVVENIDPIEIEERKASEIIKQYNSYTFLKSEPSKNINKEIGNLYFQEFNEFNLAEYIDTIHYFGENYIDNLPLICAILYKQKKHDNWNNLKIEPYEYDLKERSNIFYSLPITDVYGIIPAFISWKENFEDNYAPLFEPEFEADENYEPEPEDEKEDKLEEDKKRFSWERFIYNLCEGDLTKSDKVLELKLIYIFNILSMRKTFGD